MIPSQMIYADYDGSGTGNAEPNCSPTAQTEPKATTSMFGCGASEAAQRQTRVERVAL